MKIMRRHSSLPQMQFLMTRKKKKETPAAAAADSLKKTIIDQIPKRQQKSAEKIIDALESLPEFKIHPTSLGLQIGDTLVPQSNMVNIIKYLRTSNLAGSTQPAGTHEVLKLLAKTGMQPSAAAASTELQHYFKIMQEKGAETPSPKSLGRLGQMFEDVKRLGSRKK